MTPDHTPTARASIQGLMDESPGLDDLLQDLDQCGIRFSVSLEGLSCVAPPGALTLEHTSRLRQRRDDVTEVIRGQARDTCESAVDIAPVTSRQQWLWNLIQERPSSANAWTVCYALRIDGEISPEWLRQSVELVVNRHESLRTRIVAIGDVPRQAIDPPGVYQLSITDLACIESDQADQEVKRVLSALADAAVDLAAGPLFKTCLLRLNPKQHILAIAVHHIVTDAESLTVVFEELWAAYRSISEGQAPALPEVTMQCADYAAWQRGPHVQARRAFWQERLADAAVIDWPSDVQGSSTEATCGFERFSLTREQNEALRELARSQQTIPAMIALASYAVMVWRWCGKRVFAVPFNMSGRQSPAHARMTGYFVHPLFLRMEVHDQDTFGDLLQRIKHEFGLAQEHSDFGAGLGDCSHLLQGGFLTWVSSGPLLQAFSGAHGGRPGAFSVSMLPLPPRRSSDFPLTFTHISLHLNSSDTGLTASVMYRSDRLSAETLRSWCNELQALMTSSFRQLDRPLHAYKLEWARSSAFG